MYNVYKVTTDSVCLIVVAVSISSASSLGSNVLGIRPGSINLINDVSDSIGIIKIIWYWFLEH